MIKRILQFLLFLTICIGANSQEVNAANNAIKMGYNFVTVSQTIVFNSAMQAGGTLTLSANAMDGGGRAPGDPFVLKLVFYNSSNAIVNTAQLSNTLVYGATTPATYTMSTTNCGGSCNNVAYVSVQFYGKDGGYWAGNYGPYIINPSLSFNGGPNILYNPEFGVYGTNGFAQGWASTAGWQNCALYSGAATCVINNGAPVNSAGGGYSASGGTTSSPAGGQAAVPAGPTVVGGTITQTNAPTNQTITSGGSSTAGISAGQQTKVNTWKNTAQQYNNYLYIDQVTGNYNNVSITQSGTKNTMNLGIVGNSNTVTNTQTGVNYIESLVQGNLNQLTSNQSNTAGTKYQETKILTGNNNSINAIQKDNGNNVMFNTVNGSNNSINAVQEGTGGHYLENKLTGNGNTVIANQSGNTANKANIDLTNAGGAASVDLQQTGGKLFTIIQSCTNPAGCNTVVRQ